MSLNLALVISGDATGAKRAAIETASAVQTLGRETRNTSSAQAAAANANRQAETAHKAATEAIRGEAAAQRDLTAAVMQFAGVRQPSSDSDLKARAADIEAYGAALDQIRAKHVPLFAVQRQYGAQLDEIAAAARVGAITEDERAAAALRAKAAYDLQIMSLTRGGGATKLAAHEIQNLSFQANDLAMMLMSGQSFGVAMAQQGSQIAQIFGRRGLGEIIPALGVGIASLVTPTTLALAGITALYYGASWAFSAIGDNVRSVDDVLSDHEAFIREVGEAWPDVEKRAEAYGRRSIDVLRAVGSARQEEARQALQREFRSFAGDYEVFLNPQLSEESMRLFDEYKPFAEVFRLIGDEAKKAVPDVDAVQKALAAIRNDPSSSPEIRKVADEMLAASEKASDLASKLPKGEDALKRIGGAAAWAAERFDQFVSSLRRLDEGNRNPLSAIEQAERDYATAIGSASSREERDDAYAAYQRRLQRIREAQEIAQLQATGGFPMERPNRESEPSTSADVLRGQEERLQFLQLEAQLIGASDEARARLIARLEAEQDLRRRGIDLQSQEAQAVLANAEAIAESEVRIDKAARAWERWRSAGENAIDGVVDRLLEGDLEGALEELGKDALKYTAEMLIKNPLKNAAYGSGLPTMEDAGGIMGLLAKMFGGADKTAQSALGSISGQTVGSMNVTAASVVISGAGIGSLLTGNPAANVTKLLSPANGNDPNVGSTIDFLRAGNGMSPGNSWIDLIGRAEGTARGRGYNETLGYGAFTGGPRNLTGMTLDEIDALQKQMLAHPANTFNSSAVGLGQITRRTMRGLRTEMGLDGSELFDKDMQDQMILRLAQRRGPDVAGLRNEWEGLRNVDPAEILKAYEGTSEAVKKLGTVALPATENLDLFGSGLGDIGKSLTDLPGGGGGILGWIMKLLGGIGGFEGGTEGAPPGWAWVGEKGPELRKLRQGDVIRSNSRSRQMVAESQAAPPAFGAAAAVVRQDLRPQFNFSQEIHNYADVEVTSRQRDDGAGGVREEIFIERKIAAAIGRPGSAANKELRAGGFRQRSPRR